MNKTINAAIEAGCVMAMILSWYFNHSIWWMILHGWIGWIYVIYRGIKGGY